MSHVCEVARVVRLGSWQGRLGSEGVWLVQEQEYLVEMVQVTTAWTRPTYIDSHQYELGKRKMNKGFCEGDPIEDTDLGRNAQPVGRAHWGGCDWRHCRQFAPGGRSKLSLGGLRRRPRRVRGVKQLILWSW
jgi:hypothetical protein